MHSLFYTVNAQCSVLMILVIISLIYTYLYLPQQLPHRLSASIATMHHLEMTFDLLIILFNEIFVQSCSYCLETHSAHDVTLLNCEKLECRVRGHLLFRMGSMQSLISTRRLHQIWRPTKFNMRLDFRLHRKMQTTVKHKRWLHQKTSTSRYDGQTKHRKTLINWFFILCCMFPVI